MKVSRLLLMTSLILVLLTAACGAEGGTTPTLVGTMIPGQDDLTGTPFGTETIGTAETAITAETAAGEGTVIVDGTATLAVTDEVGSQATAVGSPVTGTTLTPGIPVTGSEIVLVDCQFCVDTWAQTLLVLPDTATFQIVSPDPAATTATTADMQPSCSTVEVNNGRQVVLCSGPEMTPITLNICTDVNTCTDFPIDLLPCPVAQQQQPGAVPNQTQPAETGNATPGVVISTATP